MIETYICLKVHFNTYLALSTFERFKFNLKDFTRMFYIIRHQKRFNNYVYQNFLAIDGVIGGIKSYAKVCIRPGKPISLAKPLFQDLSTTMIIT